MIVLISAATVAAISLGVRQSFGVFLAPVTADLEIGRQVFGLAIALQQILWGLVQPVGAAIADRYGARRVVMAGAVLYALGCLTVSFASAPWMLYVGFGVFVGAGMGCSSFAIVFGAVARAFPAERRSAVLGLVGAGGSFGMFAIVPVAQGLLDGFGWSASFTIFAMIAALMFVLAFGLGAAPPAPAAGGQSLGQALREAAGHSGFWLLTAGFFVCGFHVAFIATHLPAYVADRGLSTGIGALALALVGFFNIIGSYGAGILGGRYRKKYLLSLIYLGRAGVILAFLLAPPGTAVTLAFAGAMGLLWLSTVPLTSGMVGQIFGAQYMGTLFSLVFLSHQVGSFLGAWSGGAIYDATGSYDLVWFIAIALSLLAAALHWPIRDQTLARPQPA